MQTSTPTKLLLSAREAAKALSISEKSLWLYSSPRGPIPVVRLGSRVLYDPRDLRAWIEGAKTGEEPEDEDDYEAGSTAELIRAAESGEEFILAFALCRSVGPPPYAEGSIGCPFKTALYEVCYVYRPGKAAAVHP